jgi:hypothetical protein
VQILVESAVATAACLHAIECVGVAQILS